ncbi:MAG TPA: glycosyltransferase, partial [Roseococcus sp.]|nr:glycosyltransferase [Roseococcus sp.]
MISLVVATMGRVAELRALLDSLLGAQGASFEVLLVDQNADARLDPVVAGYAPRLPLRHLRMTVPHANAARNFGLRHARGAL